MAKNDQEEAFEKLLQSSLSRIIDFVKFAEAKNGALVAFSSAWIVGIANLLARDSGFVNGSKEWAALAALLFSLSLLFALISFFPLVNLSSFFRGEKKVSRHLNLHFYDDIRLVDISEIESRLGGRYLPEAKKSVTSDHIADLSIQIHVNSKIASRKFSLFKIGITFAVIALTVLAISSTSSFLNFPMVEAPKVSNK